MDTIDTKNGESTRITRSKYVVKPKARLVNEKKLYLKKIMMILKKPIENRTVEDVEILTKRSDLVREIQLKSDKKEAVKKRLIETEDPIDVLDAKCQHLAAILTQAKHLIIYTGAGISTAAKIPDYRGPNGIWTRLQQGKKIEQYNISSAEPTFTHMALWKLYKENILKYIVSQNCDGLHLRSGIPRNIISELHGNMYIEVCKNCKPNREYLRLFDVTENTARYSHKTMRNCYYCNESLIDTIVHFGERGTLQWPLNWPGACKNADEADIILCLGSSLKVMKRYPWLWQMGKPAKKRPAVYIVNLQWTPKDDSCALKINGKCDRVMQLLMQYLNIEVPVYDKRYDPIFYHCTELHKLETHTMNQPTLKIEKNYDKILDVVETKQQNISNTDDAFKQFPNLVLEPNFNQVLMQYFYMNMLFRNFYSLNPNQSFLITPIDYTVPLSSISQQSQQNNENRGRKTCNFCYKSFTSIQCQFYDKHEPLFHKGGIMRFSKSQNKTMEVVCQCCDYTTDDDEFVDEDNENQCNDESINKMCNNSSITPTSSSSTTTVGWFGKGYRKNRKIRKKQFSKLKTD